MDLTHAKFAENQNRMEQDKEADEDIHKIPVVRPPAKGGNQDKDAFKNTLANRIEYLKEGPVTTSKEAPDMSEHQAGMMEHSSLTVQENTLAEMSQAGERLPNDYFTLPTTLRKNPIPPRRAPGFEQVQQTPHIARKSSFNAAREQALAGPSPMELSQQTPFSLDQAQLETQILPVAQPHKEQRTESMVELTSTIETQMLPAVSRRAPLPDIPTTPLPATPLTQPPARQKPELTRRRALLLALLLIIVVINASAAGFGQAFGPQGWASVLNGPEKHTGPGLLNQVGQQLGKPGLTPGATGQAKPPTPQQVVEALLKNMSLDQKLGQMLMVRFSGQNYGPDLNTMITQYHVGSVIEYYPTNIGSKSQLIALNAQIQQSGDLPMIVSIDQEGGTVDRLQKLDGTQPSAATIGASGDPNKAYQQGLKDGQDLASYGFNLNLAPVVDVTNVYNSQLAWRTYGNNPTIVSTMAEAYLKGLQQGGKVLGTIKHFPGLGDTSTDPHSGLPRVTRSLDSLNTVDWAPYKNLFSQHNVYSVMITHELVQALDSSLPSSLSPKTVDILRQQLGFQGVIITDGLTMGALVARYTLGQSAALAVEAGDDLLMDPGSPNEVAQMIDGIKQAMSSGAISQQRIDDAVRRILLFKYQMGLLHIHS